MILFALIRAVAVAIAFGIYLRNADWMPIACLAAMKSSLAWPAGHERFEASRAAVRLMGETGVELSVDGCAVEVGSAGDDDEFGAGGPVGPLAEPANLASLPDYLEQVSVVRIAGAVLEPLDPVDRAAKKPNRREERVDVDGGIAGVGPVLESAGPARRAWRGGRRRSTLLSARSIPAGRPRRRPWRVTAASG